MDHAPPAEAKSTLADLVRINQKFGGHSVLRRTLAQVVRAGEKFTLLDVGAASGDSAALIRKDFPAAVVTSLDYNWVNLGNAPPPKLIADAFQLPFPDASFDYVLSTLFLHHFQDEQVITLLRSFYGIARRALVICDLERHVLPYLFLRLTKPVFGWGRITVHDGLISIRASFRRKELLEMGRAAGIPDPRVQSYRPAFRLAMVAAK